MPNQRTQKNSRSGFARLVWGSILLTIAATPLIVVAGMRDAFRTPKTIFFHAAMLAVAALTTAWMLLGDGAGIERLARHRRALIIAAAAVTWTALASILAVQPEVARYATLTVFCHAILFASTVLFARGTTAPLAALFVPAVANASSAVLQALRIWSPIELEKIPPGRLYAMALLGNPDYVGTYLLVPCVAAIAGAMAFTRYRILFIGLAAVLLAGLFFAQSVTAVGAIAISIFSFLFVIRSMRVRLAMLGTILVFIAALFAYEPTRERSTQLLEHVREGRFNDFTSSRLPPFVVAIDMFREHPFTGTGPGGFEARYMSHKLAADERFPEWIPRGNLNFGEVHNDHLQLLAETGLPGYLIFLAALAHVGALSFRRGEPGSDRANFVRLFAFPAVIAFATVALGQFPLFLPSTMSSVLFAAALAESWSADENR